MQTQLLTSLKPLSIHTHNRNGPPNGGLFLFLFFCPRGDAENRAAGRRRGGTCLARLQELAEDYMDAAIRLRAALDEVRAAMEDEGADRRALEQRARLLEGMLREMRELRRLTEGYYTRPRDGTYTAAFWYAPRRDSLE